MIASQTLAFAVAAAILTMIPGQDTLLVVRNVLRGGRGAGFHTTIGICCGLFMHATLSALGLSVILLQSATAFQVVKLAGACYLTWLGVRSLTQAARGGHQVKDDAPPVRFEAASGRHFREGLLSNALNPKTAIFYLAFLPQFIGPGDDVFRTSIMFAGIHFVEATVWLAMVSLVVAQTHRLFLGGMAGRWLEGIGGAVFVGFGVRLALEK